MRWFGRKAAQDAPGRPFLLRGGFGMAGEAGFRDSWPGSYEAQVREAVLGNPVAQRCVRLVSEAVGSVVIDAVCASAQGGTLGAGGGDGGLSPALRHSPEHMKRKSAPAPERIGGIVTSAVLESAAVHLLLHGNAFVHVALGGDGVPGRLFALRPERVRVEADAGGWPVGYRYRAGAAERVYPADAVVHVRAVHPLDDHYGLGCLGAAAGAVAVHNAAARWNKALLDNAARPSGALVYDPGDGGVLSGAQYERLRAEMAAEFSGSANAGRPMLLEGGLKWQAMSLTPADMDFVGVKAGAAREIALAFGVPPMLVGLPGDAAYANYREAVRSLWRLTVLPMAGKILDGIAEGLSAWRPGLRLSVDVDQVSALHEDRAELWRQVAAADFLTLEEKREMLGFVRERPSPSHAATPSGPLPLPEERGDEE